MRILMAAIGSTGDVRPFILLGRELASRGHRVTIAAFSAFREPVLQAGLAFAPLSGDAEKMMASIMTPGTGGLTYLPRLEKGIREAVPGLLRDLTACCREADALICNFFGSVFYSIAEMAGIPCVQTYYFPMDPNRDMPVSSVGRQDLPGWVNRATYRIGYLLIGIVERRYLGRWRKENHLAPRRPRMGPDYRLGGGRIPVIYALSPGILPRPADWGEGIHMSGFWLEEEAPDWQPPEALARFLHEGPPPVYIGFGSMNSGDMEQLMETTLEAVHAAGLRAVVHLGWSGVREERERDVFFLDYVPHGWLFPRVAAVVHHGGIGTTAAGLQYGKPTLIIPFGGDQPFWGYHIRRLGCGPEPLPRKKVTAPRLTAALRELTGRPEYRENAEKVMRILRQEHGVRVAADLIESALK